MRKVLLFLLFASWLSACNHRHEEFPSLFWDSIALHDSVLLPDSLLDKGLQQAIEADDSLHISLIYFFKGKKLHQDFFLLRAQECYEKARQYLPTPSPSRLQMELDIAQADFCRFNHFASQETRLLKTALDKALQEQDSLMLVRIGLIRSSRSKSKKEFDQALAELRMADQYAASVSIEKQAELQAEMAVVHLYMEQPDSALADIERAIATGAGRQNFYRTFCKGIRFHIARNDSAHYYFRQIAEMYPLSRKTDAYRYMSEALYHRGENLKAFDFLREHVRYRDSLDADKKSRTIGQSTRHQRISQATTTDRKK